MGQNISMLCNIFLCMIIYACSDNKRDDSNVQKHPANNVDTEFTFDRDSLIKDFMASNEKIIVHDTIVQAFGDSVEILMRFIPKNNNKIVIPKIYYEELDFDSLVVNDVIMQVVVKGKRLHLNKFFKKEDFIVRAKISSEFKRYSLLFDSYVRKASDSLIALYVGIVIPVTDVGISSTLKIYPDGSYSITED